MPKNSQPKNQKARKDKAMGQIPQVRDSQNPNIEAPKDSR